MSISDLLYKIKQKYDIDNSTIVSLLVVIGVGISAFGLGRLSVNNNDFISKSNENIEITPIVGISPVKVIKQSSIEISDDQTGIIKNFVASKNGKLYYPASCTGAKRIKEENRVWFESTSDAEKAGYEFASSCK